MSKAYKNIDDLFKDKFENFEVDPPDYLWDKVKSGIPGNLDKGSGFNFNNGGIAGLTLIMITLGFLSFFVINNSFIINDEEAFNEQGIVAGQETELYAENLPENRNPQTKEITFPNKEDAEVENLGSESIEKKKKKDKEKKNRVKAANPNRNSSLFIQPELSATIPPPREAQINLTANPFRGSAVLLVNNPHFNSPEQISPKQRNNNLPPSLEIENNQIESEMVRGQEKVEMDSERSGKNKNHYREGGPWAFGVYFTPEMISYPSDNELKNYSYSLDLHANYKMGNYFLQSGLGLARTHEQGNSQINYNKYLGSYEDVYNVTFDSTSGTIIPVYHTETVNVYDSINHVEISSSKRYYTYLQIPLFVGYGKELNRFGWFVKGGPSISFLVHKKLPESDMNPMDALILNVEDELPGRINTNWQFVLSAGVTYKLGSRISISVEPMFRYYIKSVYEQDKLNTKHPYSIGLRTGFLLNF